MTQDNFSKLARGFLARRPFAPFTMELVSGIRIEVNHPEAITLYEGGICSFQSTSDVRSYFEAGAVVRFVSVTGAS